jgi:hypothetical protein
MTSLTDTQVVTASGGLVELGYQFTDRTNVAVSQTTLANATELVSTTVVCDGSPILIEFQCCVACASGEGVLFGVWVDGTFDSTFEANTNNQVLRMAYAQSKRVTPSAGSHTISIRWWRWTGSTLLTSLTGNAVLRVSKIVQATQWPAVTTGTIICTSTTRPASPFEGQKIYQTDDNRELTYDSSAWVQTNSLGGWSTWTPQLYQNGNLTSTIPHARYTRIGDTAIVQARVNATQAGTAGNQIEIRNLPYSAEAAGDYVVIGNAVYWDGTLRWLLHVETLPTATSIAFGYDSAPFAAYGGGRFGQSPSKAVASGHFISFATTYEIA